MNGLPLFPREASTFAPRTDLLFLFLIALASFFTLIIVVAIVYFVIRYRRRSDDEVPPQISGSNKIEITWITIPTLLALVAFYFGARLYMDLYAPPANAMDVFIVARQWMWKAQHTGGQEEIDELHVPVGQPVKLTMTSQDVIHSFFVPDFRVKQDVLPGRYTTTWFEATTPGEYRLFCAEYCGTNHAHMLGRIIAMDPAAYANWLNTGATQSPASVGARLLQQYACVSCHRNDSLRRAPPLEGLYGQPVRLAGGGMVVADESYLRESILDPSAKVVEGYQPIMPTFQGQLDEDQLFDLIVYIKSIGPQTPGAGLQNPVAPSTLVPPPTLNTGARGTAQPIPTSTAASATTGAAPSPPTIPSATVAATPGAAPTPGAPGAAPTAGAPGAAPTTGAPGGAP